MKIRELKGLGVKSEQMLASIGITSADLFLKSDPFELYLLLKKNVPGTSLNLLYAMLGAQENRSWQDIKKECKTSILLRLDDMGIPPN